MQFWLLKLINQLRKLYRKYSVLLAVHTSGASPQSSASHLLTFLVAQLQFLREWKLSDRRLYEVFERRLLIWGNTKERNSPDYYPFQKHAFFLRHPVLMSETCWAHKKWNKTASDIKLVFYSSTITMMHGSINIRFSIIYLSAVMHLPMFRLLSAPYTLRPPNTCMIKTLQISLESSNHPNIFISLLLVISLFRYYCFLQTSLVFTTSYQKSLISNRCYSRVHTINRTAVLKAKKYCRYWMRRGKQLSADKEMYRVLLSAISRSGINLSLEANLNSVLFFVRA